MGGRFRVNFLYLQQFSLQPLLCGKWVGRSWVRIPVRTEKNIRIEFRPRGILWGVNSRSQLQIPIRLGSRLWNDPQTNQHYCFCPDFSTVRTHLLTQLGMERKEKNGARTGIVVLNEVLSFGKGSLLAAWSWLLEGTMKQSVKQSKTNHETKPASQTSLHDTKPSSQILSPRLSHKRIII